MAFTKSAQELDIFNLMKLKSLLKIGNTSLKEKCENINWSVSIT